MDSSERRFVSLWPRVASRSCPYRNLCSILACCYFIDFHGFHEISWIPAREDLSACGPVWPRVASRSCPYRNLCSILAGCYFIDFHGFHGFHEISRISGVGCWQPVAACGIEVLPLKKPLLDPSLLSKETFARSWLAAIPSIFMDFMRFHAIS